MDIAAWIGAKSEPPKPKTWAEEFNEAFSVSYKTRITGFLICLGLGILCCIIAFYLFIFPRTFAKLYTLGSLLIVSSTFFLFGPTNQLKTMFESNRIFPSVIYISAIIITLYSSIILGNIGLTLVSVIAQFLSLLWYGLSYIPFAQQMIISAGNSILPR